MAGTFTTSKRCGLCGRATKVATPSGTTVKPTDEHGHCERCVLKYRKCERGTIRYID